MVHVAIMNIMKKVNADCVIALEFGRANSRSRINVNREIAELASSYGLPILAQELVAGFCNHPFAVISKNRGYLDTWEVLSKAKLLIDANDFENAILVVHKAHLKRAKKQAKKLNVQLLVSEKLPENWDSFSSQWWTRSKRSWSFHELYTVPYLFLSGKL